LGVFLDQILADVVGAPIEFPAGACLQVLAAAAAYACANRDCLKANEFSFGPVREVALLFVGIFATMVPALDFLRLNAAHLGVNSPTALFWGAGGLSSFLDNAPTYLTYLSAAHGLAGMDMGPQATGTPAWLLTQVGGYPPAKLLLAISLGAVFFGANTYIGNGPNFMVKSISESRGVAMPSFGGYILRYTIPVMIPVLIVTWLLFVR